MGVLKSQFGLIACVVYCVITAIALVHDLTRKPGPFILVGDPFFSTILILPGLIILGTLLELLGVKNITDEPYRTPLFVASAVLTATLVYLLGADVEVLYKRVNG
jgi:hypothetical protein